MVRAITLCLALLSCAPTYRIVAHKCPTTTQLLGDFGVTATALAMSAIAYNRGDSWHSAGYATFGMSLALADNLAETSCGK